ncbi:Ig-like domain-containing protein [bacterium]|nr:Ig-like domain-containing protein [bacterium]
MKALRFNALLCVGLLGILINCGTEGEDPNGNGNNPTEERCFILGNIGTVLFSDGSFELWVSRLDTLSLPVNQATVTLNAEDAPIQNSLSDADDALFLIDHIGYGPSSGYEAEVFLGSKSATCALTTPSMTSVRIDSPSPSDTYTPGEALFVSWSYTGGGSPDSVELCLATEHGEGDTIFSLEAVFNGNTTSHNVPASATADLEGELWISVSAVFNPIPFTGDLASEGSGIVILFEAATLIIPQESDSGDAIHLTLFAHSDYIAADGSTQTLIEAEALDQYLSPVSDGTPVYFSTTLGHLEPSSAPTAGGVARTTLTAPETPGIAILAAASGIARDTLEIEFYELVNIELTLGPGPRPEITWMPPSEFAYELSVQELTPLPVPRWTIVSTAGFTSPVNYGEPPRGATQLVPLSSVAPDLTTGTSYRLLLVTAHDDTTIYEFIR